MWGDAAFAFLCIQRREAIALQRMFEIALEFSQVTMTSSLMEKDGQLFSPTLKQTEPS